MCNIPAFIFGEPTQLSPAWTRESQNLRLEMALQSGLVEGCTVTCVPCQLEYDASNWVCQALKTLPHRQRSLLCMETSQWAAWHWKENLLDEGCADKSLHSLHHYRLLFCRPPWHLTGIQSLPQQRYPKQRSSSRHMPLDKTKVGVTGMKSDALAACQWILLV